MKIKNFFVNGRKAKISKDVLSEDISKSLLPPVTPEDVGKVVSVNESGEYYLSEGSSGSTPLIVTFSGTTLDGDAACDKTWDEIQAAGQNIVLQYHDVGYDIYVLTPTFMQNGVVGKSIGAQYIEDGVILLQIKCSITSGGSIDCEINDFHISTIQ